MHPIENLVFVDRSSSVPIYSQIVTKIAHNIRAGHLRTGSKLPGCRALAAALNINRRTLQLAFDELHAQGWLEIHPRKGAFVAPDTLPDNLNTFRSKPDLRNCATAVFPVRRKGEVFPDGNFQQNEKLILAEGFPDIRLAPTQHLFREIRSLEKRGRFKKYFQYGGAQGILYLRECIARYLTDTRGLPVSPSNILITRGAQMGIYLSARVLLSPGDEVVIGEPGFLPAVATFQRAGATINPVPVDDAGIDVDEIEALCRKKTIRLVYVTPQHHHPTTVTLSSERRTQLLHLARRYRFAILEDDYDFDFHYSGSPVLPLASLDTAGSVVYVGTMNKTLTPSMRLGFIVAPDNFVNEAISERRSIDYQGDSILEVAIAELLKSGVIEGHTKKVVRIYKERRDYFCFLLNERLRHHVDFDVPLGGLAVWANFRDTDVAKLAHLTERMGVQMHHGSIYHSGQSVHFTRLGFAALSFPEQEKAVDVLVQGLEQLTEKRTNRGAGIGRYDAFEMRYAGS
jgi:GntR family transcriptional regulator/MocR family aminotransferase